RDGRASRDAHLSAMKLREDGSPEVVAGRSEVFSRVAFDAVRDAPRFAIEELYGLMDPDPAKAATNVYDMREVIARIVDRSEFDEYKADFGRTVLCGYAR